MTTVNLADIPNFLRKAEEPEWIEPYYQAVDEVIKEEGLKYKVTINQENLAFADQMEGWTEEDSWVIFMFISVDADLTLDEEIDLIDKVGDAWNLIRPQRPDITYTVEGRGD